MLIGLETARAFLETVKKKHPEISYSDLWILASYVALEVMNYSHRELNVTENAICISHNRKLAGPASSSTPAGSTSRTRVSARPTDASPKPSTAAAPESTHWAGRRAGRAWPPTCARKSSTGWE